MPWSRFRRKRDMPEGIWIQCKKCSETLFNKDLEANFRVCSKCGHHFHLPARERLRMLMDEGSFTERWGDLHPPDRLGFVDKDPYPAKLEKAARRAGIPEAAVAGTGLLDGHEVAICCLDFYFMGGSMGTVVGEKVTRTLELATSEAIPAIVVSCSGGARMHEGVLSLMQMAKTAGAIARLNRSGGLYLSVLSNPTTGGVIASFAALGDVIFAEPRALIGFAGPRVIQETLRTELPEGFQTSEFLLEHGFVDRITPRSELKAELAKAIRLLWRRARLDAPAGAPHG
jgi:acetyl-CoA carboxylase carboxyl transferase subunit beta